MSPAKPKKPILARTYAFLVRHAKRIPAYAQCAYRWAGRNAGRITKIATAAGAVVGTVFMIWREKNADVDSLRLEIRAVVKTQQVATHAQEKTDAKVEDLGREVSEIKGGVNTLIRMQGGHVPVAKRRPLTLTPEVASPSGVQ
jgi:hypothetical protein